MNNKYLLHCLLALCVGLLPALSASAASIAHPDSIVMDCPSCDPVETSLDSPCENHDCNLHAQSCGSHYCANYFLTLPFGEIIPIAQVIVPGRYNSDYQQAATDPIYRPPIA
ncbi:MAG: hypothetical protein KJN95_04760 [Gammaproteobacteria bacterium]|nr:hypothetical protein [Gammaproteobacteria bacterium]